MPAFPLLPQVPKSLTERPTAEIHTEERAHFLSSLSTCSLSAQDLEMDLTHPSGHRVSLRGYSETQTTEVKHSSFTPCLSFLSQEARVAGVEHGRSGFTVQELLRFYSDFCAPRFKSMVLSKPSLSCGSLAWLHLTPKLCQCLSHLSHH